MQAKAELDALKAERDAGQEQVAADEQRLAEGDKAPDSEPSRPSSRRPARSRLAVSSASPKRAEPWLRRPTSAKTIWAGICRRRP